MNWAKTMTVEDARRLISYVPDGPQVVKWIETRERKIIDFDKANDAEAIEAAHAVIEFWAEIEKNIGRVH